MSRAAPLLLGAVLGAAVVGPLVWFVTDARIEADSEAARSAELEAAEARRAVHDWERKWRAEWTRAEGSRERVTQLERELQVAEGEIARLSASGGAAPDSSSAGNMGGHSSDPEPTAEEDPTTWDERRLRREMELLSADAQRVRVNPRLPLLIEAYRGREEQGFALFREIVSQPRMPAGYHVAVSAILEGLDDERGVDVLLASWDVERDDRSRRAGLRALAALPGDRQVDALMAELAVEPARPRLRMTAMHGLARRLHPHALAAARGEVEEMRAPLRARAIQTLLDTARDAGFPADDVRLPAFEAALSTVQGSGQAGLVLTALEGFRSPSSIPALRAFAGTDGVDEELAVRAVKLAESLESGE